MVPSECASNLARFDGLKYGMQMSDFKDKSLQDYIKEIRSEGFGTNVKRRILIGNFF